MSVVRSPLLKAALLIAALFAASSASIAQGPGKPPVVEPRELVSPQERLDYCNEMHNASTLDERLAIARRMRDTLVARAKEKGVTLPSPTHRGMRGARGGTDSGMHGGKSGLGPNGEATMRSYGMDCGKVGLMVDSGEPGAVAAQAPRLDVHYANGIAYVSGGVGQDEADAMRAVRADYSMRATFATSAGTYLSDVAVRVENADGSTLFTTRSDGPFLYAKLPAGHYRLVATSDRIERARTIDIPRHGSVTVTLTWPALTPKQSG
ncbi:carboxypeptidase-like regulatory domain-containing protein [Paraburkholderia kururiensis]|uniref:carboxypeptidase-like regulatory domain-containing protein n=1 Tax=Paraburkholderia kururiensis TaxID=984307 RepID=UPI0012E0C12E|nr:carboxypeptidase-like regulatory domain-containing protein [Paraburkholderia kururiensis]